MEGRGVRGKGQHEQHAAGGGVGWGVAWVEGVVIRAEGGRAVGTPCTARDARAHHRGGRGDVVVVAKDKQCTSQCPTPSQVPSCHVRWSLDSTMTAIGADTNSCMWGRWAFMASTAMARAPRWGSSSMCLAGHVGAIAGGWGW